MEENTDTVADTSQEPTTPVQTEQTTQMPQETVDTPTETLEQTPDKPKEFTIPDEYKDKGWAAKVKSEADMFKQLDNLSSLVGKKEILKQPDWEDEQSRNEFVSAMRPDDKADYEIPDTIGQDEADFYRDVMHENGISATQAKAIFEKVGELRAEHFDLDDMIDRQNKMWGKSAAENNKLVNDTLAQYGGDELKATVDALPNAMKEQYYSFVANYAKAHGINETDIAHDNKISTPKTADPDVELDSTMKFISNEQAKGNPDWGKIGEAKIRVNELYAQKFKGNQ
jgi:hypothetical protein